MDILNCLFLGIILIMGYLLYKKPSPQIRVNEQEKQAIDLVSEINAMIKQVSRLQLELMVQAVIPDMLEHIKNTSYEDMRLGFQRKFQAALSCIGDASLFISKNDEYRALLYKAMRYPNPEEEAQADREFFSHFETVKEYESEQRAV